MRSQIFDTPGSNAYFEIPDDCNVIWVSGCGSGGGGAGGATSPNYAGGDGGAASPCVFRIPLSVNPGGALAVYVGNTCAGGSAGGNATQPGAGVTRGFHSCIAGRDLISPFVDIDLPYFMIGHGQGAQSRGSSFTGPVACLYNRLFASAGANNGPLSSGGALWEYVGGTGPHFPVLLYPPFANGGGGGSAGGVNPTRYGKYGDSALFDNGMGTVYASDATYASGGAGAGGLFGRGGNGGVIGTNSGIGGDASGYGSGGGGGAGNAAGGSGTGGLVVIEY